MSWHKIGFGKYAGKTLPQLLFADPDYFFWAYENGLFKNRPYIAAQAQDIFEKATMIKAPKYGEEEVLVEYHIDYPTRKFAYFIVVPESKPTYGGASLTLRMDVIDMSIPRQLAPHDKLGCRTMISSLKYYCFGDKATVMSKKRCEAFFDDPDNFE